MTRICLLFIFIVASISNTYAFSEPNILDQWVKVRKIKQDLERLENGKLPELITWSDPTDHGLFATIYTECFTAADKKIATDDKCLEKIVARTLQPELDRQRFAVVYHLIRNQLEAVAAILNDRPIAQSDKASTHTQWEMQESGRVIEALALLGNSWRREKFNLEVQYPQANEEFEEALRDKANTIGTKLRNLLKSGQGQALKTRVAHYPMTVQQKLNDLYRDVDTDNNLQRLEDLIKFSAAFDDAIHQLIKEFLTVVDETKLTELEALASEAQLDWAKLASDIHGSDRRLTNLHASLSSAWQTYLCREDPDIACSQASGQLPGSFTQVASLVRSELRNNLHQLKKISLDVKNVPGGTCFVSREDSVEHSFEATKYIQAVDLLDDDGIKRDLKQQAKALLMYFNGPCAKNIRDHAETFQKALKLDVKKTEDLTRKQLEEHQAQLERDINVIAVGAKLLLGELDADYLKQSLKINLIDNLHAYLRDYCPDEKLCDEITQSFNKVSSALKLNDIKSVEKAIDAALKIIQDKELVVALDTHYTRECLAQIPVTLNALGDIPSSVGTYVPEFVLVPSTHEREDGTVYTKLTVNMTAVTTPIMTPATICSGLESPILDLPANLYNTGISYELPDDFPEGLETVNDVFEQRLAELKALDDSLRNTTLSDAQAKKILVYLRVPPNFIGETLKSTVLDPTSGLYFYTDVKLPGQITPLCLAIRWSSTGPADCEPFQNTESLEAIANTVIKEKLSPVMDDFVKEFRAITRHFSTKLSEETSEIDVLALVVKSPEGYCIKEKVSDLKEIIELSDMEFGQSRIELCYKPQQNGKEIFANDYYPDPNAIVNTMETLSFIRLIRSRGDNACDSNQKESCRFEADSDQRYTVFFNVDPASDSFQPIGELRVRKRGCHFLSKAGVNELTINRTLKLVNVTNETDIESCFSRPELITLSGQLVYTGDSDSPLQNALDQDLSIYAYISHEGVRFGQNDNAQFKGITDGLTMELQKIGLIPPNLEVCNLTINGDAVTPIVRKKGTQDCMVDTLKEINQHLEKLGNDFITATALEIAEAEEFQDSIKQYYNKIGNTDVLIRSLSSNLSFVDDRLNDNNDSLKISDDANHYFDYQCRSTGNHFQRCDLKLGNYLERLFPDQCAKSYMIRWKRNEVDEPIVEKSCLRALVQELFPEKNLKDISENIDSLRTGEYFDASLRPDQDGIDLTFKLPITNKYIKEQFYPGNELPILPMKVAILWDGRITYPDKASRQLQYYVEQYLAYQAKRELEKFNPNQYFEKVLAELRTGAGLFDSISIIKKTLVILDKQGQVLEEDAWFKGGSKREPSGIQFDATLRFGEEDVLLQGVRWLNNRLNLSKVRVDTIPLENYLKTSLNLASRFDNIRVETLATSESEMLLRLHANFRGFEQNSINYALDAIRPYMDIRLSLSDGISISTGSSLELKQWLVQAMQSSIQQSNLLPLTISESPHIRFDEVSAAQNTLVFHGKTTFNAQLKMEFPTQLHIHLYDGSIKLTADTGGLSRLIQDQLFANLPMPELPFIEVHSISPSPLSGMPTEIRVKSSAKAWEVFTVSIPDVLITPSEVKFDSLSELRLKYKGEILIPPYISLTDIGGTVSEDRATAEATMAPIKAEAKHIVRLDGTHIFDFDNPLKFVSHSEIKFLNFMSLGRTHREVDVKRGTIKERMDLGGAAKDIIDFTGESEVSLGNQTVEGNGQLSLFNAFAQGEARFKSRLTTGAMEAYGKFDIQGFMDGNLDFSSKAFFKSPRAKGKFMVRAGQFEMGGSDLSVTRQAANLHFRIFGLSLGLGVPNLLSFDEDTIVDMIRKLLSPDLSNLDKALLSLLKGNFNFNPMSSFGGGEGSGLDGDGSDGSDGGEGSSPSADGSGGYAELASDANAAAGVDGASITESEQTSREIANSPAGEVPIGEEESFNPQAEQSGVSNALPQPAFNNRGDMYYRLVQDNGGASASLKAWLRGAQPPEDTDELLVVPRKFKDNELFLTGDFWRSRGETLMVDVTLPSSEQQNDVSPQMLVTALPHTITASGICKGNLATHIYWFTREKEQITQVARQPLMALNRIGSTSDGCWKQWGSLTFKENGEDAIFAPFLRETGKVLRDRELSCERHDNHCIVAEPVVAEAFWLPANSTSQTLPEGPVALAVRYQGDTHFTAFVVDQQFKEGDEGRRSGVFSVAFMDRLRTNSDEWPLEKQSIFLKRLLVNDTVSTEVYSLDDNTLLIDDDGMFEWNKDDNRFEELPGIEPRKLRPYVYGQEEREKQKIARTSRAQPQQAVVIPEAPQEPFEPGEVPTGGIAPVRGLSPQGISFTDIVKKLPSNELEVVRHNPNNRKRTLIRLPESATSHFDCNPNASSCRLLKGVYLAGGDGYFAYFHHQSDDHTLWDGELFFYSSKNPASTKYRLPVKLPPIASTIPQDQRITFVNAVIDTCIAMHRDNGLGQSRIDYLRKPVDSQVIYFYNNLHGHGSTVIALLKEHGYKNYQVHNALQASDNSPSSESDTQRVAMLKSLRKSLHATETPPNSGLLTYYGLTLKNQPAYALSSNETLYLLNKQNIMQRLGDVAHVNWDTEDDIQSSSREQNFHQIFKDALEYVINKVDYSQTQSKFLLVRSLNDARVFWFGYMSSNEESYKMWKFLIESSTYLSAVIYPTASDFVLSGLEELARTLEKLAVLEYEKEVIYQKEGEDSVEENIPSYDYKIEKLHKEISRLGEINSKREEKMIAAFTQEGKNWDQFIRRLNENNTMSELESELFSNIEARAKKRAVLKLYSMRLLNDKISIKEAEIESIGKDIDDTWVRIRNHIKDTIIGDVDSEDYELALKYTNSILGIGSLFEQPAMLSAVLNKLEGLEDARVWKGAYGAFLLGKKNANLESYYFDTSGDSVTIIFPEINRQLEPLVLGDVDHLLMPMTPAEREAAKFDVQQEVIDKPGMESIPVVSGRFGDDPRYWLYLYIADNYHRILVQDLSVLDTLDPEKLSRILAEIKNNSLQNSTLLSIEEVLYLVDNQTIYAFSNDALVGIDGFDVPPALSEPVLKYGKNLIQTMIRDSITSFDDMLVGSPNAETLAVALKKDSGHYDVIRQHDGKPGIIQDIKACDFDGRLVEQFARYDFGDAQAITIIYPLEDDNCNGQGVPVLVLRTPEGIHLDFLNYFSGTSRLPLPAGLESEPMLAALSRAILEQFSEDVALPEIDDVEYFDDHDILLVNLNKKRDTKQDFILLKSHEVDRRTTIESKGIAIYDLQDRADSLKEVLPHLSCILNENGCSGTPRARRSHALYLVNNDDSGVDFYMNESGTLSRLVESDWKTVSRSFPEYGNAFVQIVRALNNQNLKLEDDPSISTDARFIDSEERDNEPVLNTDTLAFTIESDNEDSARYVASYTTDSKQIDETTLVKLLDIPGQSYINDQAIHRSLIKYANTSGPIPEVGIIRQGDSVFFIKKSNAMGFDIYSQQDPNVLRGTVETHNLFIVAELLRHLEPKQTVKTRQIMVNDTETVLAEYTNGKSIRVHLFYALADEKVWEIEYDAYALEPDDKAIQLASVHTDETREEVVKGVRSALTHLQTQSGVKPYHLSFYGRQSGEKFSMINDQLSFDGWDASTLPSVDPRLRQTEVFRHWLATVPTDMLGQPVQSFGEVKYSGRKGITAIFPGVSEDHITKIPFYASIQEKGELRAIRGKVVIGGKVSKNVDADVGAISTLNDWITCPRMEEGDSATILAVKDSVIRLHDRGLYLYKQCEDIEVARIRDTQTDLAFLLRFLDSEIEQVLVQKDTWKPWKEIHSGQLVGASTADYMIFNNSQSVNMSCENEHLIFVKTDVAGSADGYRLSACDSIGWNDKLVGQVIPIISASDEATSKQLILDSGEHFLFSGSQVWLVSDSQKTHMANLSDVESLDYASRINLIKLLRHYKATHTTTGFPVSVIASDDLTYVGFQTTDQTWHATTLKLPQQASYQISSGNGIEPVTFDEIGVLVGTEKISAYPGLTIVKRDEQALYVIGQPLDNAATGELLVANNDQCRSKNLARFVGMNPLDKPSALALLLDYYVDASEFCDFKHESQILWMDEQHGAAIAFSSPEHQGDTLLLTARKGKDKDSSLRVSITELSQKETSTWPWYQLDETLHRSFLQPKDVNARATLHVTNDANYVEILHQDAGELWVNHHRCGNDPYQRLTGYSDALLSVSLTQETILFKKMIEALSSNPCQELEVVRWITGGAHRELAVQRKDDSGLLHLFAGSGGSIVVKQSLPAGMIASDRSVIHAAYRLQDQLDDQVRFNEGESYRLARHLNSLYWFQPTQEAFGLSWSPVGGGIGSKDKRLDAVWDRPPASIDLIITNKDSTLVSVSPLHVLAKESNKRYTLFTADTEIKSIAYNALWQFFIEAQYRLVTSGDNPIHARINHNCSRDNLRQNLNFELKPAGKAEENREACFSNLLLDTEMAIVSAINANPNLSTNGYCAWAALFVEGPSYAIDLGSDYHSSLLLQKLSELAFPANNDGADIQCR